MPVPMAPETRSLSAPELRVEDASGKPVIVGYAAVFNSLSEDLGGFKEIIQPGAFAEGLDDADIRALFNHNPTYILGRNKAKTLHLAEDSHGLLVRINPPDTQIAHDVIENIRLGNLSGMSFRFYVEVGGDEWYSGPTGMVRVLKKVLIDDVSVTPFPAYPATEVSVRCLEALESFRRSQPRRTPLRDNAARMLRLIQADR